MASLDWHSTVYDEINKKKVAGKVMITATSLSATGLWDDFDTC